MYVGAQFEANMETLTHNKNYYSMWSITLQAQSTGVT